MEQKNNLSKKKIAWFSLLSVILIALFLEFFSWLIFFAVKEPELVYHSSYMNGYAYHPYLGFRWQNYPYYGNLLKSDNTSVYITGGSTASGVGVVNFENQIHRVLEKNLIRDQVTKNEQVINLAVPGFVSNQEAAVYKNYIFSLPIPPKVVVSFTSFNDIYFYLYRTLEIGTHEFNYEIDYIFRKGYPSAELFVDKIKNMVRRTHLFKLSHVILNQNNNQEVPPIQLAAKFFNPYDRNPELAGDGLVKKVADNFLENCLATAILAKYRGTKFIVVLQPTYYYGGDLTTVDNEWFNDLPRLQQWISDVGRQKNAFDKFYALVIAGLENYKNKGYLDYLDYRDKLKSAGKVYKDPVHYNDEASKFVTDELTRDIEKIIKFNPVTVHKSKN